jgi:hypothetical protein
MQQSSHDGNLSVEEKGMQQSSHDGNLSIMERVHRLRKYLQRLRNQYPDKIAKNVAVDDSFKGFDDWCKGENW